MKQEILGLKYNNFDLLWEKFMKYYDMEFRSSKGQCLDEIDFFKKQNLLRDFIDYGSQNFNLHDIVDTNASDLLWVPIFFWLDIVGHDGLGQEDIQKCYIEVLNQFEDFSQLLYNEIDGGFVRIPTLYRVLMLGRSLPKDTLLTRPIIHFVRTIDYLVNAKLMSKCEIGYKVEDKNKLKNEIKVLIL